MTAAVSSVLLMSADNSCCILIGTHVSWWQLLPALLDGGWRMHSWQLNGRWEQILLFHASQTWYSLLKTKARNSCILSLFWFNLYSLDCKPQSETSTWLQKQQQKEQEGFLQCHWDSDPQTSLYWMRLRDFLAGDFSQHVRLACWS